MSYNGLGAPGHCMDAAFEENGVLGSAKEMILDQALQKASWINEDNAMEGDYVLSLLNQAVYQLAGYPKAQACVYSEIARIKKLQDTIKKKCTDGGGTWSDDAKACVMPSAPVQPAPEEPPVAEPEPETSYWWLYVGLGLATVAGGAAIVMAGKKKTKR